jgi:hypothetical protein
LVQGNAHARNMTAACTAQNEQTDGRTGRDQAQRPAEPDHGGDRDKYRKFQKWQRQQRQQRPFCHINHYMFSALSMLA